MVLGKAIIYLRKGDYTCFLCGHLGEFPYTLDRLRIILFYVGDIHVHRDPVGFGVPVFVFGRFFLVQSSPL